MNTRSGYVIDDTADLQSTRHLTQATSCRTIYRMPFVALKSVPRQDRLSSTTEAFRLYDPQLTPVCAVDPG